MIPLSHIQLDCLLSVLQNEEEYVFLDTSRSDEVNCRSLLFMHAYDRVECFSGDDPDSFLQTLQALLADGKYLAGWMAYEFSALFDPERFPSAAAGRKAPGPLASFGVFPKPFFFDHRTGETDFPFSKQVELSTEFHVANVTPSLEKEKYLTAVAQIKEYLNAGDTYQVNYTLKLLFEYTGSVEGFYRSLRSNQSVAYGALMRFRGRHICSFSPELFFAVEGDTIRVRPMKGTMKRGRYPEEDQALCTALREDEKNRSENVMIVDLLRNDLGHLMRILGDKEVVTDSLFDVERYESLLQMTSSIHARGEGKVLDSVSLSQLFRTLFPCGSVTGAPKIRTMEIIAELESGQRGVYTGGIGWLSPTGEAVFNVPIRTISLFEGKGEMGIGSGIVYDSDPFQEWDECLLKGHFLTRPVTPFYLFETLLFEAGKGYWLLDEHLQRLRESADFFCFAHDEQKLVLLLEELSVSFSKGGTRLRVALHKDGRLAAESNTCAMPGQRSLPVVPESAGSALPTIRLSETRVDSLSVWFYHKTGKRDLFTGEFQKAQQEKHFDRVFLNEEEQLTEGCISNVVLYLDGRYVTPPISSGLLAGTMRRHLLQAAVPVVEQIVSREDLFRAEALFCCNSVRGVVQVRLVG